VPATPTSGIRIALPSDLVPLPEGDLAEMGEGLPGTRKWLEPVGVAALLLSSAGLLCAARAALCVWVLPLSALAALVGLLGVVVAQAFGKYRLLCPVAGSVMGLLLLLTAAVAPGVLGPNYAAYRQRDPRDPRAIRAVPLSGGPAAVPQSPDWVDASRFALQQGGVRVQVAEVSVRPAQLAGKTGTKERPEEHLVIRVRAKYVEATTEFAADPFTWRGKQKETPHATLSDDTGRVYASRPLPGASAGQEMRGSSLFPVSVVENVFGFEPPPAGLESLRLELPASAWGGRGAFRFTIPATMIRRQPAAPAGGRRGRGG
jgi:hypothetical protein